MGLIMKKFSRNHLFFALLVLLLITSPCKLTANNLGSKLEILSTALTGLKGKLGMLKSKLGELQDSLTGELKPPTFDDDDEELTTVTISWTQTDPKVAEALTIEDHNGFLNYIVNPNQINNTTDIILDMNKLQDKKLKRKSYYNEQAKFISLKKLLETKKSYPYLKKIWIYSKNDFGFFSYMVDSFGNTKSYNSHDTDWTIDYPFASIPASTMPPLSPAEPTPAPQSNQLLITLVRGDITKQQFAHKNTAAIVNAANSAMRGGGGIDYAIHSAAGAELLAYEANKNLSCPTGEARITPSFNIKGIGSNSPDWIIHTVGPSLTTRNQTIHLTQEQGYSKPITLTNKGTPTSQEEKLLENAYRNSLQIALDEKLKSIAFCAISTALFGYRADMATHTALQTILNFVETKMPNFTEIRFVTFSEDDYYIYKKFLNDQVEAKKLNEVTTSLPAYLQTNNSTMEPPLAFQLTPPTSAATPASVNPHDTQAQTPLSSSSISPSSLYSSSSSSSDSKKVRLVLVAGDITKQHFQDPEKAAIANGANNVFVFGGGVSGPISQILRADTNLMSTILLDNGWSQDSSNPDLFTKLNPPLNFGKIMLAFPPGKGESFIKKGTLKRDSNGGLCSDGSALIHMAHPSKSTLPLPFKYLVQVVGPDLRAITTADYKTILKPARVPLQQPDRVSLKYAYSNGLLCAEKFGIESIAFPVVSGGVFGYPIKEAIEDAVQSCVDYLEANKATTNIKEIRFVVWINEKDRDNRLALFKTAIKKSIISGKTANVIEPLDQEYYETNNLYRYADGTPCDFIKVYEFDLGKNQSSSSSSSSSSWHSSS